MARKERLRIPHPLKGRRPLLRILWSVANEEVSLTREQAIAELEALRAAGAFDNVESLRGKYARPRPDISEDELNDYLRQIGREWESELDDLGNDN